MRNRLPGNLTWKPAREDQTTPANFGDPTATTGYQLCVFYRADYGLPWSPLIAARAAAGANWEPTARGLRFRDPATAGGVVRISLESRPTRGTEIKVAGRGPVLALPEDFTALGIGPEGSPAVLRAPAPPVQRLPLCAPLRPQRPLR